jgi:hypothetical protein
LILHVSTLHSPERSWREEGKNLLPSFFFCMVFNNCLLSGHEFFILSCSVFYSMVVYLKWNLVFEHLGCCCCMIIISLLFCVLAWEEGKNCCIDFMMWLDGGNVLDIVCFFPLPNNYNMLSLWFLRTRWKRARKFYVSEICSSWEIVRLWRDAELLEICGVLLLHGVFLY